MSSAATDTVAEGPSPVGERGVSGLLSDVIGADDAERDAGVAKLESVARFAAAYRAEDAKAAGWVASQLPAVLRERGIGCGGAGTPEVSEFCSLELGAAMRIAAGTAHALIADSLDLCHRLPHSLQRCRERRLSIWVARKLAQRTRDLTEDRCHYVDQRFARQCGGLPPARQLRLVEALVIEADLARAEQLAEQSRADRFVRVRGSGDGGATLVGRLDLLDAHRFHATADRLADVLRDNAGMVGSHAALRARAVGLMASPPLAMMLLHRAAQPQASEAADLDEQLRALWPNWQPVLPDEPRVTHPAGSRADGADCGVHETPSATADEAGPEATGPVRSLAAPSRPEGWADDSSAPDVGRSEPVVPDVESVFDPDWAGTLAALWGAAAMPPWWWATDDRDPDRFDPDPGQPVPGSQKDSAPVLLAQGHLGAGQAALPEPLSFLGGTGGPESGEGSDAPGGAAPTLSEENSALTLVRSGACELIPQEGSAQSDNDSRSVREEGSAATPVGQPAQGAGKREGSDRVDTDCVDAGRAGQVGSGEGSAHAVGAARSVSREDSASNSIDQPVRSAEERERWDRVGSVRAGRLGSGEGSAHSDGAARSFPGEDSASNLVGQPAQGAEGCECPQSMDPMGSGGLVSGEGSAHSASRWCGPTISTPLHRLLPSVALVVHISYETAQALRGVARVEGAVGDGCPVSFEALLEQFDRARISVRPVVDLNQVQGVDRYEIPFGVRDAVLNRDLYEPFPGSQLPSRGLDLDHTRRYHSDCQTPESTEQTSPANLAPLGRRTHRAKTAGLWSVSQPRPGELRWTSPLGLHYRVTPSGVTDPDD